MLRAQLGTVWAPQLQGQHCVLRIASRTRQMCFAQSAWRALLSLAINASVRPASKCNLSVVQLATRYIGIASCSQYFLAAWLSSCCMRWRRAKHRKRPVCVSRFCFSHLSASVFVLLPIRAAHGRPSLVASSVDQLSQRMFSCIVLLTASNCF